MATGKDLDSWTLESLLTLKAEVPTLRNRLKEANSQQERLLNVIRKQEVLINDQRKIIEELGDTISAERTNTEQTRVSELEELKNMLGALQEQVDLRNENEDKVPTEEQVQMASIADSIPDAKLKHMISSLLGTELKEKHRKVQTLECDAQLLKMKVEELTNHCFDQCGLMNQQQRQIEKLQEEQINLISEGFEERRSLLRRIRELETAVEFMKNAPTNGQDPRLWLQTTMKQEPVETEAAARVGIAAVAKSCGPMQEVGPGADTGSANAEPPSSVTDDNRQMKPGRQEEMVPWRLIPLRL